MPKITIDGIIGLDVLSSDIARDLTTMRGQDVVVEMSTPGGLVSEGIAIFNRLRSHDGAINFYLFGNVSSMGTYIAMSGDNVEAEDNIVFMIHNPSNCACGDYRIMQKSADNLEGLAGLLSKEYARKTKKPISEIRELMDDETRFFGAEMVDAGFVDKLIKHGDDVDRAEAVAISQAEYSACLATMKNNEKAAGDIEQAAAMISEHPSGRRSKNPANAENKQEVVMGLETIMAENPAVKAEVDAFVRKEKEAGFLAGQTKGQEEGKAEMQARIDATANYLGETKYPASVQALAVKVLRGDESSASLTAVITVLDAQKENAKSDAAKGEQGGETPPNPPCGGTGQEDGSVASEEDYQAELSRAKGGK